MMRKPAFSWSVSSNSLFNTKGALLLTIRLCINQVRARPLVACGLVVYLKPMYTGLPGVNNELISALPDTTLVAEVASVKLEVILVQVAACTLAKSLFPL